MNEITYNIIVSISVLLFFSNISLSANNLVPNEFLGDNRTLISPNESFELGFFSLGRSNNRYLGIWYKNIVPFTVIWIANRNNPITNSSGVLKIAEGILVLNQGDAVIWSTERFKKGNPVVAKPIAMLLDSGNFLFTEEAVDNEDTYHWQSFDDPTDTLLPGMKLGWDLDRGYNNSLVSWKSDEDPSPGDYIYAMEPYDSPEIYLLQGQTLLYRTGMWNGIRFSGTPEMRPRDGFEFIFVQNGTQKYFLYTVNRTTISRVKIDKSGRLNRFVWYGGGWIDYLYTPNDKCDKYKECGSYGMCNTNDSPICSCPKGFEPRNEREWNYRDGSSGCVLKTSYVCGKDDDFFKLERIKLPDSSNTYYNKSMQLTDCRKMCEKNCSCTAYANPDIRDESSGCIFWIGDLVDLRQYPTGGQDIYVRIAASELGTNHKKSVIIISAVASSIILLLALSIYLVWRRTVQKNTKKIGRGESEELPLYHMFRMSAREPLEDHEKEEIELPLVDFHLIVAITNNFSNANKLGEGGFGAVYKGMLADGKNIAVKRLSKTSRQGVDEFKNEAKVIAKLQHRNLVGLLGCCIEGEEKILIYEYMPNKSLDAIIFDKKNSFILDWVKRLNIIVGIARGLLYLHQDSRFRIVHRDLKASNILLDNEMNPKISDFGLARIFGGDQTEANTGRVVGTYGYMAPEYAMDGLFSVKSDVFSYGVLMLEILSGRRNRGFYAEVEEDNILGHAWSLWEEGKGIEIIDETLRNSQSTDEMMKCLQISLLCVQEHAEERPTISSVVQMLSRGETAKLAMPNKPGFSLGRTSAGKTSSSNDYEPCSVNSVTITEVAGR